MLETASVVKVQQENPMVLSLTLHAPEIAAAARPGQFVMLKSLETFDPLLRRPFSIMDVDKENGDIFILLKVVGLGTALLNNLQETDEISLLGPLGNGFDLDVDAETVHLVGGGTGITPLYFLAKELRAQGKKVVAMLGFESVTALLHAEEFSMLGCSVRIATMDGSMGCPGSIYLLVKREFENGNLKYLYACGPNSMLREVDKYAAAHEIPGQVCLESKMVCGIGACKVCTCALAGKDGKRASVCKDGPVFAIGEVEIDG